MVYMVLVGLYRPAGLGVGFRVLTVSGLGVPLKGTIRVPLKGSIGFRV